MFLRVALGKKKENGFGFPLHQTLTTWFLPWLALVSHFTRLWHLSFYHDWHWFPTSPDSDSLVSIMTGIGFPLHQTLKTWFLPELTLVFHSPDTDSLVSTVADAPSLQKFAQIKSSPNFQVWNLILLPTNDYLVISHLLCQTANEFENLLIYFLATFV